MELCGLFLHSLNRETMEEVQNFPLRSYEEVLEGALWIDQTTIDSVHKTYGTNGRLITPNQGNSGYPNNMNKNQGPKVLNMNHGVTTDGVTDQAKKPIIVSTPNTKTTNNNNINSNNQKITIVFFRIVCI